MDLLFKSQESNYLNKKNTNLSILTQNDFRSNAFLLVVCFVPAPNNNKLKGKKDDIKYRCQYSEALSHFFSSWTAKKLRHYTILNNRVRLRVRYKKMFL